MTDETPKTEQPKPDEPAPEVLTPAEQRANAFRMNAYLELADLINKMIGAALSVAELQMGPTGKLFVAASPTDLANLVASIQTRLQQVELGFSALVDMILQIDLVTAVANPDFDKDDPSKGAPMLLKSSGLNKEQFWLMCAKGAEAQTSRLRRGLLSQGKGVGGAVSAMLRKPS